MSKHASCAYPCFLGKSGLKTSSRSEVSFGDLLQLHTRLPAAEVSLWSAMLLQLRSWGRSPLSDSPWACASQLQRISILAAHLPIELA